MTVGIRRGPRTANRKQHERRPREARKTAELQEIAELQRRTAEGVQFASPPTRFTELPISAKTLQGLDEAHFVEMTDIQKCALPVALGGLDVLGAAKTGSGKTLAFLIPILERLYRDKWGGQDGLGALILAPTRELALQTFEVLRKIGRHHSLSAGLVIGGKDLKTEQEAIARMNILVATPGRLLQHMDQTSVFDWSQLRLLVLDEADRILDLGFAKTVDAILAALPRRGRQTMLFSATQTASVAALARLSLHDPVEMSVHAEEAHATPDKLEQRHILCPLPEKIDRLYSFIKANLKGKMIVFLASCKQVRFVFEAFCKLQPGVPLMHLHGRQKQGRRMAIFYDFCRKPGAVLFATDVAARGLDFPAVDWVVQADCPEDVETYIHRVGRTARADRTGNALLFLEPSERAMLELLRVRKIPIRSLYHEGRPLPPAKRTVRSQLQALCSQDPALKYLAQKALVCYIRSIHLNGNRDVFKVGDLDIDGFAASLGLPGTPKLRFVAKSNAKNASRQLAALAGDGVDSESEGNDTNNAKDKASIETTTLQPKTALSKVDKMFRRKNLDVLSEHYQKLRHDASPSSEEDDFLTVKRRDHEITAEELDIGKGPMKPSRRDVLKTRKKYSLKGAPRGERVVFDDDGGAHKVFAYASEASFDHSNANALAEQFVSEERSSMAVKDKGDADAIRLKRRAERIEKKRKAKETARSKHAAKVPRVATLAGADDSAEESGEE